jgi:ATP-binding cassette subfamily C (CFTR/MRP) protein 1
MTVDIQRFQDMATWIMYFFSAPLQVSLAIFFLWRLLGIAIVAGLVCLVAFIPLNAKLSLMMRTLQVNEKF